MLIILTLYLVLAWVLFTQLKIIKLGWVSGAVTAIIEHQRTVRRSWQNS
jgi:hypothetical protein